MDPELKEDFDEAMQDECKPPAEVFELNLSMELIHPSTTQAESSHEGFPIMPALKNQPTVSKK